MPKFSLKIGKKEFLLETTSENKETVKELLEHLPLESEAERWGEEIYFFVEFDLALERGRRECVPGEVAFWPDGPGIAVFFGKTPVSTSDKSKAYSPCNFFAKLVGELDFDFLDSVESGEKIVLSKAK